MGFNPKRHLYRRTSPHFSQKIPKKSEWHCWNNRSTATQHHVIHNPSHQSHTSNTDTHDDHDQTWGTMHHAFWATHISHNVFRSTASSNHAEHVAWMFSVILSNSTGILYIYHSKVVCCLKLAEFKMSNQWCYYVVQNIEYWIYELII